MPGSSTSRHHGARAGLLALLALTLLAAWPARAQEPRTAEDAPTVSPEREQMLLREAFRYLRLSRSQVSQLLWFARQTDRRRITIEQEEARALRTAAGGAARDPVGAERLRQALAQNRAQAEAEIVRFGLFHLVRTLTREQIALAWRLELGRPPEYARCNPALCDPAAGFVSPPAGRGERLLYLGELDNVRRAWTSQEGAASAAARLQEAERRAELERARAEEAVARVQELQQREDLGRLLSDSFLLQQANAGGDPHFPQRVIESPSLDELAPAIEPFARRLFTSAELVTALQTAAARGLGSLAPRPAAPAGSPRLAGDYRIFRGFSDLTGHGADLEPLGGEVRNGLYAFGAGQGVHLEDAGVTDHYAIELVFRCGQVSGYQKLVDFKKRSRDTGLYLLNGTLMFYDLAVGHPVEPGRDHHLRLERSRTTHVVRATLDHQFAFAFIDLDDEAAFDEGQAFFFIDDKQTNGEQGPGTLASLAVWDRPSLR